jgi:Xaa-Pro aminopeptidase
MSERFRSDFFAGNRERLRQLFTGTAPIVLTAHGLLQKSADESYPFYQDRNFWYLTGIDEPDIILVMDKAKEYLIVPTRETVREVFEGALNLDELRRISGVQDIYNEKEGWKHLESRLKKVQHIATLSANPKYIDFLGMYSNPARTELIQRMKVIRPNAELLDLRQHLARMRMVKQPVELQALQAAIDVTAETLKAVTRPSALARYGFEYEVEAEITHGFRRRGAQGHAFDPVVASGERACTMHHVVTDAALASDELLIVDVGARVDHYAADLARTYSIGGHPTRRQQQVYDAVSEAQEYAYSLLKPGVIIREYEKEMEQFMGEKLRELGLIQTITREAVRTFFPHATTHFLGLDAHDAGDYDFPLEPGVTGVVEPGIYIPEEGFGVRIEDNFVVTETGIDVLSAHLPRRLA